ARVDVAKDLAAVLVAVHPDVDHGRPGPNHVRGDEVCASDGSDEDLGVERVPLQILRARVADRDGCVALKEEMCHRLADNGGTSDDDGARALEWDLVFVEHPHNPER